MSISDFDEEGLGVRTTGREPDAVLRYDALGHFAHLVAEGRFTVPVVRTFSMEDWHTALELSHTGRAHGKLLIVPYRVVLRIAAMCRRYVRNEKTIADCSASIRTPAGVRSELEYRAADVYPMVRLSPGTREREIVLMRWGFVPFWARDARDEMKRINARAYRIRHRASRPVESLNTRRSGPYASY